MGKVILRSNRFCVESNPCNTIYIEYSDNRNVFGFNYENSPVNFVQSCRIPATLRNTKYQEKKEVYRTTGGVFRNTGVIIDKIKLMVTDWMDEVFHDALSIARVHKTFTLDGIDYSGHGDYELSPNDFDNLQQAQIEVFEQAYNQTNISC